MNHKRTLLALAGLLTSLSTLAAPTATWTTSDTHVYAETNGLESTGTLASGTSLTNQFAAQGIGFSGTAYTNGCGIGAWSSYGMGGNYVHTYGPGCYTNNVVDTLSIKFSSDVSRLAMDAYSYYGFSGGAGDVVLLNDGNVVASLQLNNMAYQGLALYDYKYDTSTSRYFYNYDYFDTGILVFDGNGSVFDEIRFVESSAGASAGNYVVLDNLRFDTARVPEPASLALVGLALGAVGFARRRKA